MFYHDNEYRQMIWKTSDRHFPPQRLLSHHLDGQQVLCTRFSPTVLLYRAE